MDEPIRFVAISGSLRKKSFNTFLLKQLPALLPENVSMETASIADIPVYNGDLDIPEVPERPAAVVQFRQILKKADAFIILSPEYNYSIPGGLKNAIDWASRGADSPLLNKPVALMGATPGMWGTVRMQQAFHPVFQALNMISVNRPEVLISQASSKFNEQGNLTDDKTKDIIRKQLEALKKLVVKSGIRQQV